MMSDDEFLALCELWMPSPIAAEVNARIGALTAERDDAVAEGERRATAAIVAYARGATGSAWSRDVLQFADAIERGEHLKRPGDTPTQFPVAPDWHEHFGPEGISLNKPAHKESC